MFFEDVLGDGVAVQVLGGELAHGGHGGLAGLIGLIRLFGLCLAGVGLGARVGGAVLSAAGGQEAQAQQARRQRSENSFGVCLGHGDDLLLS